MSYYANRLKRSNLITQIDDINEKCKMCFVQTGSGNERNKKINTFCSQCDSLRLLRLIGTKLLNLEKEDKKFSAGEIYYIVNHLDVLGIAEGLFQVARRLERCMGSRGPILSRKTKKHSQHGSVSERKTN